MELLTYLIIASLATFQITFLLTQTDGPYFIFARFRALFNVFDVNIDGVIEKQCDYSNGYNLIGAILECPFCTLVWISVPVTILTYFFPWAMAIFAIMGIATIIFFKIDI